MKNYFDMHLQAMILLDALEIFKNGCQLLVNLLDIHPHCLYSFYSCEVMKLLNPTLDAREEASLMAAVWP